VRAEKASHSDRTTSDSLFKSTEELVRQAIKEDPLLAAPYAILGTVFVQRGNYSGAIVELEKAFTIDPEDALAQHNLGGTLLKQGDTTGA
jgi:Flp pilus assembly protein TadD